MPSKGGRESKISSQENGVVSFTSKDNLNTFCRSFLNLAESLLQKLSCSKNKFGIKTTKEHYKQIENGCQDFVLQNVEQQLIRFQRT